MATEFSKWVGNLPHKDYETIRKKIMDATGVSSAAYSMWYRGENNPDMEKQLAIAEIAYLYNRSTPFRRVTVKDAVTEDGKPTLSIRIISQQDTALAVEK